MILCEVCNKVPKTQIKEGKYCCDNCQPPRLMWGGYLQTQYIKGYGKELKSRVDELKRRVILPVTPEKGSDDDYYVGRRNENGTVSEKEPDY